MPRKSLSGFLSRAPYIDVQRMVGAAESYSGTFAGNVTTVIDAAGGPMRLSYTPPVDAWWDVRGVIGNVVKVDAAYHYLYGQLLLAPADVDGVNVAQHLLVQHSAVNQYDHRDLHRLFKLAAGVAYTATLQFAGGSGGTWQFYRGQNHIWIEGLAWPR